MVRVDGKTIQRVNGHRWYILPSSLSSPVKSLHFKPGLKASKTENLEWFAKVFCFCMTGSNKAEYATKMHTIFLFMV